MTFGLLTPLFLAGLAALAVPVLVHLVHRQDRTSVAFPSLMFLRRIPTHERRRRTIRHWWLLLLRCLALALLCLAFAQPFIGVPTASVAIAESSRDRIVVLDRSYSMGYAGRWQQAVRTAQQAIGELGREDRAALVLFDQEPEVAQRLTTDHESLSAILAVARPGAGGTNLLGAVEGAGRLLNESDAPHKEIVVISDFQRTGFEDGKSVLLPAGVRIVPRPISGGDAANAAVAMVKAERRRRDAGEAVQLLARVINSGPLAMEALVVTLEVNGRQLEQRMLSLAPGEVGEVPFSLVTDAMELSRVAIRLADDALAVDNAHHLVLTSGQAISVLLLQDREARPQQALHLVQALGQGDLPVFQLRTRTIDDVKQTDIDAADVIFINDAPIPGGRLGQGLKRFLSAGGGLLIVAADRIRGTWPNGEHGIVPGVLGRPVDRTGGVPVRLLALQTTHPALTAFNEVNGGDLASAQVYRYRELTGIAADATIARYDDGAVALAERRVGRGRVLVFTTTLDPYWNTFPMQPGYLPFVHEMLKYLAGYVPAPEAFAVGHVVDLERYARALPGQATSAAALARGAVSLIKTPSGAQQRGAGVVRLREPGFYEAHVSGSGARSLVIAANPQSDESKLEPVEIDAFLAAITSSVARQASSSLKDARTPESGSRREGWWFVLLACALLLAAETLVSNRLSEPVTTR